jgi:hypothetical protein
MRCLSLLLSFVISVPLAPFAGAQTGPKISLVIVEGEGAINNVRQRTVRQPIVQVEDENHKPIAGAAVLFTLPDQGAGGTFAGGSHTLTVMTDKAGHAAARGFRPNNINGQYQIHVSASYQGQTTTAVINESNLATAAAAAAGTSAKWIVIAAAGAAAVAIVVFAATNRGYTPATPNSPTTVTPATGTVGISR